MTGNRIRDSKRNPFFQVKVKDGKYSTENQVSYYGKKLPDDTFSFDISNQKVQANLDEFGTIRHITFFLGNYAGGVGGKGFCAGTSVVYFCKMEWTDRKIM